MSPDVLHVYCIFDIRMNGLVEHLLKIKKDFAPKAYFLLSRDSCTLFSPLERVIV